MKRLGVLFMGALMFAAQVHAGPLSTETPTPTPSPSPTVTPTPWVIYGTPTAVPSQGSATIPGNIYKPLLGQALQLQAVLPEAAKLSIEIYDRLGRSVRRFEQEAGPGAVSVLWDGRSEEGSMVATGIYVAHFKARGFSRIVKFAVVK